MAVSDRPPAAIANQAGAIDNDEKDCFSTLP
jgi:hypothetical protein